MRSSINLIGGPINPECEKLIETKRKEWKRTGYYHEGVLFEHVDIKGAGNPYEALLKKVQSTIFKCHGTEKSNVRKRGVYLCGADIQVCK